MNRAEYIEKMKKWFDDHWEYEMTHHSEFDFWILSKISFIARPGKSDNAVYNDVIIMADTETSKKNLNIIGKNHVVAWTISIRAFDRNIVTLWGHKPSTMISTIRKIQASMHTDAKTVIYFHNLSYDWVFIRQFLFASYGFPTYQLNTKSHYPVNIEFSGGLILKDSLILAQRSLEKWAKDMQVEHQKSVGKWDYNKIRNQNEVYTADELEYIEHDTLAGVECLQKTMDILKKRIYSMPLTATGIPREETRIRANEERGHDRYLRRVLTFDQQITAEKVFHGGFTHTNRFLTNMTLTEKLMDSLIKCKDFSSSYPFVMLAFPEYAVESYTEMGKMSLKEILHSKGITYMFKLVLYKVKLRDIRFPMPVLQYSKCVKIVNPVQDNGRIIEADYLEIYVNEIDARMIIEYYKPEKTVALQVFGAHTGYLPRWFTDYVYELYRDKCELKNGDPVLYNIQKAKLNSLYGLTCQRPVKEIIEENYETSEYSVKEDFNFEEEYEKATKKRRMVLNYQWGTTVTSIAMRNLFELSKCIDFKNGGEWIYSDTDSIYATKWDEEKIAAYNRNCEKLLRANGYDPIEVNGRKYIPGIAEDDGEYSEFRSLHSKCYAKRDAKTGELKITVAGVPKKGAEALQDDINNFAPNFIFPGKISGKKQHTYFNLYDEGINKPYIDENGNETGDSIDLSECDYRLSGGEFDWDDAFTEEICIQVYEEDCEKLHI